MQILIRSVTVTVLVVALTAGLLAQVNTEKDRMGRKQSGISGRLSLALKLERGNSELTEVNFEPRFVWRSGKHQVFSINDLSFVESSEGSIVNDGFSHLRYNYGLNGRLIAETFVQGQYDRSQDLTQRYLVGGGLRFLALQSASAKLAIGVSAMHEHERLESGETSNIIRNSDYLSFNFDREDRLSVSATTYIQPSTRDLNDIRVLAEIGVTAWISKFVGMTSAVNYHYDSRPPQGIKEYNVEFTSGFTLSF